MVNRFDFQISEAADKKLPSIVAWFATSYCEGDDEAARRYFADHFDGGTTFIGRAQGTIAGFITIRWMSRRHRIPFTDHFEVFGPYQRHGLGNRLMDAAERRISEVSDTLGGSVGLFDDCGSAQRLHVKRGYVPDGRGVCRDGIPVKEGDTQKMDDDLGIWLTKDLKGGCA